MENKSITRDQILEELRAAILAQNPVQRPTRQMGWVKGSEITRAGILSNNEDGNNKFLSGLVEQGILERTSWAHCYYYRVKKPGD